MDERMRSDQLPLAAISTLHFFQCVCFDTVGWVTGRAYIAHKTSIIYPQKILFQKLDWMTAKVAKPGSSGKQPSELKTPRLFLIFNR